MTAPPSFPSSTFMLTRYVAGRWYFTVGLARSTAAIINERMYLSPLFVNASTAFDRLGVDVTTAGNAGAVIRLGIYADVDGSPASLVVDGGTVVADATGAKMVTITKTLTPGLYWLATVAQSAGTSAPAVRTLAGSTFGVGTPNQPGGSDLAGYITGVGSVSGALPATAPAFGGASSVPLTAIRAG